MEKLDDGSRPGKQPDWLLGFPHGIGLVLEITRLAVGTVREVETFIFETISTRFAGRLPGSFALIVDIAVWPDGKVSKSQAAAAIDVLESRLRTRAPIEGADLPTGLRVIALDPSTSGLIPLIVRSSLSPTASIDDPEVTALAEELGSVVVESAEKFAQWGHCQRCLLIDISQSGLDWEFHGLRFKGMRRSLVDTLMERLPEAALAAIDRILLEPGVRVWLAPDVNRSLPVQIMAGTKYADSGLGHFLQGWPGPSRPI